MNLYILPSHCLHNFTDFFFSAISIFSFLAYECIKILCFVRTWYYTKYCNTFFVKFSLKNSWMLHMNYVLPNSQHKITPNLYTSTAHI